MRRLFTKIGIISTVMFLPSIALAQSPQSFSELVNLLINILQVAVPFIIGITIIVMLWAGAQTILHGDNPQKLADGRRVLMWGIIILFIMVTVWGFVNLLRSVLL